MPAELEGPAALAWALEAVKARRASYVLHRDYHEGRHRLTFATSRFRQQFGELFEKFRDNLCAPVIAAPLDRLRITSWQSPGEENAGNIASELWDANRMGLRQSELWLETKRCGDGFLLVWPTRTGEVRLWPQEPTACAVEYDDEDDPTVALRGAKVWRAHDKHWRANVYSAERIERWVTPQPKDGEDMPEKASAFAPFEGDEAGPVVLNPWGEMPLFHFPNGAAPGSFGRSALVDVLPLQDALNKAVADMLVAMEFVAYPQRVLIGVEREYNPETGEALPIAPGADRVWTVKNKEGRIAEFAQADLTHFLEVQESFRLEVARVAGTPVHYLMLNKQGLSQAPSGEALQVIDGRLLKSVEKDQEGWGDVARAAMLLAVRMHSGAGTAAVRSRRPDQLLEPVWDDPSTRSELYDLQVAEAKEAVGYSQRQALRELGKTDPELDLMADERATEAATIGAGMLQQFDRGQGVGVYGS